MQIDELREFCLTLPGTSEDFPFDENTLVFRVSGKIFLLCNIYGQPLFANMKCEPQRAIELREQYEQITPGYHMNKAHWNTVEIESLDRRLVEELINHSYALVVKGLTKAQKEELSKMQ